MKQVISGAFDTLSHCMETYFGMLGADNLSDKMNEAIMVSVIENLRVLLAENMNMNARSELEWAMADTCNLTAGCCKKFDRDEIFQLLKECL